MDCLTFLKARINRKVFLTSKDRILHKYILSIDEEKQTVSTVNNIQKENNITKDMNGNNIKINLDEEKKPTTIRISTIEKYFDVYLEDAYFAKETNNLKGVERAYLTTSPFKGCIVSIPGPFSDFKKETYYNKKNHYSVKGILSANRGITLVYIASLETSDFLHNRTIEELNKYNKGE